MSQDYNPVDIDDYPPRRQIKSLKPRATRTTKATYGDDFKYFLWVNLAISCLVLVTAVTSGALLVNEYTDTHWTVHYWLEGDNAANGDTFRHISMVIPAFTISVTIMLASVVLLVLRLTEDCNGIMAGWSNYSNNAVIHGCIGLSDAFITLIFTQVTGNSNLWAMVYVAILTLFGDLIGVAIRIYWDSQGRRGGSSWWAPFLYLSVKMTPLVLLAVSADRLGLTTNIKAAFWLFFAVTALRVTIMFVAQIMAIMSYTRNVRLYRWLVMQPNAKEAATNLDARNQLFGQLKKTTATTNTRVYLGVVLFLNLTCTLIFTLFATVGCGNSVCRQVYERITFTLTETGGQTTDVQFDRTWGVLEVAIPFQFGMLVFMGAFYLIAVRHFQLAWVNVGDFLHDLCFGVADFFTVWVILNMTGTTELAELLLGSTLILACDMLFAESRSKYPWYFAMIPSLVTLLPFAHASCNVAMLQNRSKQELAWAIVMFVAYGLRSATFWAMRFVFKTKQSGTTVNKYFDTHPIAYVNVRYWFNWVLRWMVVGIWLSGSFHNRSDIVNDK
jgi:hypothetical protein